MNRYPISLAVNQKGAVLLESLIAILVFSFGVLALAGLQASMLKNTDEAKYRAEASFIAQDRISEIWLGGNPNNLAAHVVTDEDLPLLPNGARQLPQGKISVAVTGARDIKVTVNWTMPGGTERTYLTNARIEGI